MTLCYFGFQTLMEKITSTVTMEVYARASRRKFTHLGGIKFDGDVRVLLHLFQTLGVFDTNESLRKDLAVKFEKLKKMAYIVSMEELNDVVESWNEGAILNLTVGDVKKICSMRIDFEKDEVERMCLR